LTLTIQFWFWLEPKDKRLIERAAKIDRRSASDFIRLAAIEKAIEVIDRDKKRR
jgi:uncharacterized protein (DUF1778 family)